MTTEKKPRGYKPTADEVREAVLMLTLASHRDVAPRGIYSARPHVPDFRWRTYGIEVSEVAAFIGCSKEAARAALRRPPSEFELARGEKLGGRAIDGLELHPAHSRGTGGMVAERYTLTQDLLLERLAAAFALAKL
jgi:hypothetical protein